MSSTCIHCTAALGSNEAIKAFPVGERLAFDPQRGRLWVVGPACERWNLSPLDGRWEAIEEAERRFRDTRFRVSTDDIGLALVGGGLDLIRIGEPQRPEMTAWCYGDRFGRRRQRQFLTLTRIPGALHSLPARERLALEKALHEEGDRRAMDGALETLASAWREAEETAAIADGMFDTAAMSARLLQPRVRTVLPDATTPH